MSYSSRTGKQIHKKNILVNKIVGMSQVLIKFLPKSIFKCLYIWEIIFCHLKIRVLVKCVEKIKWKKDVYKGKSKGSWESSSFSIALLFFSSGYNSFSQQCLSWGTSQKVWGIARKIISNLSEVLKHLELLKDLHGEAVCVVI